MDVTLEDIESIASAVWASMLECELITDPSVDTKAPPAALVGFISLQGAFEGIVTLHMAEALVRGAASVMFALSAADVSEEHMRDAVAELTNMIGGNIKCLVEQPSRLGLPEVLGPSDLPARPVGSRSHAALGFTALEGSLVVTLHQASAA